MIDEHTQGLNWPLRSYRYLRCGGRAIDGSRDRQNFSMACGSGVYSLSHRFSSCLGSSWRDRSRCCDNYVLWYRRRPENPADLALDAYL